LATEPAGEPGLVVHQPHPFAAAAARRLQHDGEADLLHQALDLGVAFDRVFGAGHDGHLGCDHAPARLHLVAHGLDRLGRRSHEDEARLAHGAGEGRALGEEPVAGVHGVGAGALGHLEQLRDLQIALGGRRGPDVEGMVGEPGVQRRAVGVGVDRDRLDAQLPAGPDDAHRDLSAVGDQYAT
jgi:hypothetical protein